MPGLNGYHPERHDLDALAKLKDFLPDKIFDMHIHLTHPEFFPYDAVIDADRMAAEQGAKLVLAARKADQIGRDGELDLGRERMQRGADRRERRQVKVDRQRADGGQESEQRRQRARVGAEHDDLPNFDLHHPPLEREGRSPKASGVGCWDVPSPARLTAFASMADASHRRS